MEKLSTNEKLNLILNGPDDDDDVDYGVLLAKEKIARDKLRKASLYGIILLYSFFSLKVILYESISTFDI
jgi:hypothetical protein